MWLCVGDHRGPDQTTIRLPEHWDSDCKVDNVSNHHAAETANSHSKFLPKNSSLPIAVALNTVDRLPLRPITDQVTVNNMQNKRSLLVHVHSGPLMGWVTPCCSSPEPTLPFAWPFAAWGSQPCPALTVTLFPGSWLSASWQPALASLFRHLSLIWLQWNPGSAQPRTSWIFSVQIFTLRPINTWQPGQYGGRETGFLSLTSEMC